MTELLTENSSETRGSTPRPPDSIDWPPPAGSAGGGTPRGRLGRLFLSPVGDPRWARPALWALLVATTALYTWNLSNSGYANDFYAAAVKSGTESWQAWLFGSLDSANAITVDKPPASLWLMVLSTRIFGFSSFATLLPQALLGVGTVAITWAAVRRWSGPAAGLLAGALVAMTPVAALMFRFNNPDAMLVFLMTLAGYFVVRAVETERGRSALRWLLFAGVAIGFAFLTKMMQGLLVLPPFALAYLVAGHARLRTRIWHLLAAGAAVVVSAGWFVALVALWPADSRPYIGGSEDNSLWELAVGYNGLGRIFGGSGGGGSFGGGNTGFGGTTGLFRMFNSAFGTEISWLIPAALVGLAAGLWFSLRFPRTDRIRAGLLLWGGSMIVTALVFSFMEGTTHPYYAVAIAPSIAAVVAISGTELWRGRAKLVIRSIPAAMIAATGGWSFVLLGRDASFLPWLRWVVLIGSIIGAALLVASFARLRRLAVIGLLIGSLTALGGTTAYAVATAATPHSGSIPTSGPSGSAMGGTGRPSGTTDGPRADGTRGQAAGRAVDGQGAAAGSGAPTDSTGTASGGTTPGGTTPGGTAPDGAAPDGAAPDGAAAGGTAPTGATQGAMGAGGATVTNTELIALLNASDSRWSAAVLGSQTAAGYILATDSAVMAIGGWSSDPSPTLAEFQQYVAHGDIGYFIAGGGMAGAGGPGGGSGSGSQIRAFVEANFTATTVGGTTVYDLTGSTGA